MKSINLDAPILPGKSLGGIHLGEPEGDLPDSLTPTGESNEHGYRHFVGDGLVVVVKRGRVKTIFASGGYRGRFDDFLGIGVTVREVIGRYGPVVEGEDSLILPGVPGIWYEAEGAIDLPSFVEAKVVTVGISSGVDRRWRPGGRVPTEFITLYYHPQSPDEEIFS